MNTSVLVLTLNEEANLPSCLASLRWCDDIVVLDSLSSDSTCEISKLAGVRFIQREFDDYATQRNFGLNDINYKYPWVLMVDADEVVSTELVAEIEKVLPNYDPAVCLFYMRRKDFFMGTWIKHSSGYPTWFGRLARIGHITVSRSINEEYLTDGKVQYLKEHLYHYPFNKGTAFWIERHNRYSSMEAEALVREIQDKLQVRNIFSRDPIKRRKALKQIAYHLPFRPFLVFCYLFFFRIGILDGGPGLTYCRLRAMYEYMINLKVRELRRRTKGLPI